MNFFEQELRKLFENSAMLDDIRFTGRACVGRLTDLTNVKLNFVTLGIHEQYDGIEVAILNRNEGKIDSQIFRFSDIFGKKPVNNPNFSDGMYPHIWKDYDRYEWYVYKPDPKDYEQISSVIEDYLSVFQEPALGQRVDQLSY